MNSSHLLRRSRYQRLALPTSSIWRWYRIHGSRVLSPLLADADINYIRRCGAEDPGGIDLTEDDYVLGLFDLVGELDEVCYHGYGNEWLLARVYIRIWRGDFRCSRLKHLDRSEITKDVLRRVGYNVKHIEWIGARKGCGKMEVMKTCVEGRERCIWHDHER
jgi:hypothetical protein